MEVKIESVIVQTVYVEDDAILRYAQTYQISTKRASEALAIGVLDNNPSFQRHFGEVKVTNNVVQSRRPYRPSKPRRAR